MKKIISLLCVLLVVTCLSLSMTACNNSKYTYWQVEARESGESRLVHVADLSYGSTNIDVTEVWINLSKFKAESTVITLTFFKSTSTKTTKECPVKASDVKSAKDGWVLLYLDSSVTCKSVTVEIVDTMQVNEICFVKSNGKLANVTFTKGGVKLGSSENLYAKNELEKLAETNPAYNEYPAFNIIDEQDKFPVEKIKTGK
jgi:hypothetical protein